MLTVACVLRSGGPYTADYVVRLRDGVAAHLDEPYRFVCLSDVPVDCERIPLETEWPRNWAKIELFKPDRFEGRVLFLDLDTDVVGDLSDLASLDVRFGMIDDWLHPWCGASGVMVFEESNDTRRIYEQFGRAFPGVFASFRRDQRYISGCVDWRPLRQLLPGQIVSRWVECIDAVPSEARVICWHGTPRPHEIDWAQTGHLDKRHDSWLEKVKRIRA